MLMSLLSSFQHLEGQEAGNRSLIHINQCDGALWLLSKLDKKTLQLYIGNGNMGDVGEFWYFPLSTVCKVFWKYLDGKKEFSLVAYSLSWY